MRIREILAEYDRSITLRTLEQKLSARIASDELAPDSIEEIMEMIESVDPSPTNMYTPWLVNQYIKNSFDISNLASVKSIMSKYNAVKKFIPSHDIGTLSLDQITDMTKAGEAKQMAPLDVIPDAEVLYNGPQGQLAIPKTEAASIALGEGTVWCTAWTRRSNQFNYYNSTGDLYIWRDAKRKDKKYQFYWGDAIQFMDRANDPVSEKDMKYFREINPITAPIFAREEEKILNSNNKDRIVKLASVLYLSGVTSVLDLTKTDPELAYRYAKDAIKERWPAGEKAIATDPQCAYNYVIQVINRNNNGEPIRWPEGEKAIATDANLSYMYAKDVINLNNKGEPIRWPAGEKVIATDPQCAYNYVIQVINRNTEGELVRWPEGEKAIATDANLSYMYAKDVINLNNKGEPIRWPAGEKAIVTDANLSYMYAKDVLTQNNKGKPINWPEGEKAIATDENYRIDYSKYIVDKYGSDTWIDLMCENLESAYNYAIITKNRVPKIEDTIATSAEYSFYYAQNKLFGRFIKGELAIAKDPNLAQEYDMAYGTNLSQQ